VSYSVSGQWTLSPLKFASNSAASAIHAQKKKRNRSRPRAARKTKKKR
jgi:hypothetical protein